VGKRGFTSTTSVQGALNKFADCVILVFDHVSFKNEIAPFYQFSFMSCKLEYFQHCVCKLILFVMAKLNRSKNLKNYILGRKNFL